MVSVASTPSLAAFQARAQALTRTDPSQTSSTSSTRSTNGSGGVAEKVVALQREADQAGVGADLRPTLQKLFPDVVAHQIAQQDAATAHVTGAPTTTSTPAPGAGGLNGLQGRVGRQFTLQGAGEANAAAVRTNLAPLLTSKATPLPLATQFPPLGSSGRAALRATLHGDLAGVTVTGRNGQPQSLAEKLAQHPGLTSQQQGRIVDALSQVKGGFATAGAAPAADLPQPPGYQVVNWKHTRLELDRVLDVAVAHGLSPEQTESAILASAFSDSVKAPSNFIAHNVHGAQAALHVLGRLQPPMTQAQLQDVTMAILEHQVGPPGFMGQVGMRGALTGAGVDKAVVDSIAQKITTMQPRTPPDEHGSVAIAFTADEHAALAKVGVPAWTVPGGGRHEAISRAVIDADSLVNYACPDGWAKLLALHGPDQPVFLQEPLWTDALTSQSPAHASARRSFDDAKAVISDASADLYTAGLSRTQKAVDEVTTSLMQWVETQSDVPRTKDGGIPYITAPLDYGDDKQVNFARAARDHAVALLRAHESPVTAGEAP